MGSRSKQRVMGVVDNTIQDDIREGDFWGNVYDAIEQAERVHTGDGVEHLDWNTRSLLYTRLAAHLPRLCDRHSRGGEATGYIMAVRQLVAGARMEFFDWDMLKQLKKLLLTIKSVRDAMHRAEADITAGLSKPIFGGLQR